MALRSIRDGMKMVMGTKNRTKEDNEAMGVDKLKKTILSDLFECFKYLSAKIDKLFLRFDKVDVLVSQEREIINHLENLPDLLNEFAEQVKRCEECERRKSDIPSHDEQDWFLDKAQSLQTLRNAVSNIEQMQAKYKDSIAPLEAALEKDLVDRGILEKGSGLPLLDASSLGGTEGKMYKLIEEHRRFWVGDFAIAEKARADYELVQSQTIRGVFSLYYKGKLPDPNFEMQLAKKDFDPRLLEDPVSEGRRGRSKKAKEEG